MMQKRNHKLSLDTEKIIKIFLILFDLSFLIIALCFDTTTMFSGLKNIINNSATFATDYLIVGGKSAAFLNTFLVSTIGILFLFLSKTSFKGKSFGAIFMLAGFSLFGKNIMNIIPFLIGVSLYAFVRKKPLKEVAYIGIFGTALGPIVSEVFIQLDANLFFKFLASYGLGIFIGFILTPLSKVFFKAHKGFNLYNVGFTDGIVAVFIISIFRLFGFNTYQPEMNFHIDDLFFLLLLIGLSIFLIIFGIILNPKFIQGQLNINKESGQGQADFVELHGLGSTLTNMGICCLISTLFMYFLGTPLNGIIFGAIISVTGFCACGNNLRNISFIYMASLLGQMIGFWDIPSHIGVSLATILGTGLAPIGGKYGILAGIISGLLHISLVQYTGRLHLNLCLYNNGFAAGLVATLLIPLFEFILLFIRKKFYKKEGDNNEPSSR